MMEQTSSFNQEKCIESVGEGVSQEGVSQKGVSQQGVSQQGVSSQQEKLSWADITDISLLEEENEKQLEDLRSKFIYMPESDVEMCSILKIPPEKAQLVKVIDQVGDLKLFHYVAKVVDPDVEHVRGVVVNCKTGRIMCKAFPNTPEYITKNFNLPDEVVCSSKCTKAYEGTILRVFCYENHWFISTHKRINGNESRWGSSITFGQMFYQCLGVVDKKTYELFFEKLNQSYCYVFLLSHPENILVCKHQKAVLHHLATYDTNNNMECVENHIISHPNIQPQQIMTFKTRKELVAAVNDMPWYDVCGVILFLPDGKMCKVVSCDYYVKKQIRGSEPNLRIRYLQLKQLATTAKKKDAVSHYQLQCMFPEKKKMFEQIEKNLVKLVNHLYVLFIDHWVNQANRNTLSREIINILNAVFNEDRTVVNKYLSFDQKNALRKRIINQVNLWNPKEINSMIVNMLKQNQTVNVYPSVVLRS